MTTRTTEWQDPTLAVAGLAGKTGLEFLRAIIGGKLPHRRSAPRWTSHHRSLRRLRPFRGHRR
jgi:hypothetical protein